MPRNPQANEKVRQDRKAQILDAALSVYVRCGYHGADMEYVSAEAGLAKGLLYYYYKTKQSMFRALFEWATEIGYARYSGFFDEIKDMEPIEKLAGFTRMIYEDAARDPRLIQFSMRLPFDVHAVFAGEGWPAGEQRSAFLMQTLECVIQEGMARGEIPLANSALAASSFWAVFVSNLFHFTKMLRNGGDVHPDDMRYADVIQFCFRGLGVGDEKWRENVK